MKTLIVAEKPSMGRTIASVIEPKAVNHKTYLEGEAFIITWAIGHLVELAEPDKYDAKYKRWKLEDLPIIPEPFKLIPSYKTKEQLNVIRELAKRCGQIINACDAGREGQLIFHYIMDFLRLKQTVKRLWISDLTPETIRNGFKHLRPETDFAALTTAAKSRSHADWLIGINGSRAFTVKSGALVSVGRVQTPVLALIYERQVQIEQFTSVAYFEIRAAFSQSDVLYKAKWQGETISEKLRAEQIRDKVAGKQGQITSYVVKEAKEYPYKLYDLTLLQREANAKYHFSAKKTLDIAQSLYEKHKVISYPRTNSNYVTEQNIPEMHRTLDSLKGTSYDALMQGADKGLVHKNNRHICNPEKVEDHHAILPTAKKAGKLSDDEQKIYDLVIRRFLAQFYPAAVYKMHTVMTEVEKELFKTIIKERLNLGWKAVYGDALGGKADEKTDQEEEVDQPFKINPDIAVSCTKAEVAEKETKPPKPYTEGTLLRAMESAGKQMEDDALREAMKDTGLGTPATRAAIIERLKQVGYIAMSGKSIRLTDKGRAAIEWIRSAGVELLASPEMTGQWERRLNEIAKGQASDLPFMNQVKKFAQFIVEKVQKQPVHQMEKMAAASVSKIASCPREGCAGEVIAGRKGYGCSKFKEGCPFVIWKKAFGKSLSDAMAKTLITKGKTGKLKFKSKSGKPYEAKLVLKDKNTGQLELEF